MVRGRRVLLLSAAALGLDIVVGGPLRHRDVIDADRPVLKARGPPALPPPRPTAAVIIETTESIDLGGNGGVAQQPETTATTTSTTAIRAPAIPPPIPTPKPIVSVESASINLGGPSVNTVVDAGGVRPPGVPPPIPTPKPIVSVESASINLGGAPVNTAADSDGVHASPTTSDDEYVYPGEFGASGSLVTDINAPTRSVSPSAKSVAPISGSKKPPSLEPTRPAPGASVNAHEDEETIPAPTPTPTPARVVPTLPRGPPPKIITTDMKTSTSTTIDLGAGTKGSEESLSFGPSADPRVTSSPPSPTITSFCQESDLSRLQTTYSVVYTSTITWVGNPEDYVPEFPPLETPPPPPPCIVAPTPARLTLATTVAYCSSTGSSSKFVTCSTTTSSWVFTGRLPETTDAPFFAPGGLAPTTALASGIVTVITTDKNPAVVFPTKKAPNYGVNSDPKTRDPHVPITSSPPNKPPTYDSGPGADSMRQPPVTDPVTVAVKPTAVVINGNTIIDDPSGKTQQVVVGGVTFTIDPNQVIGGGATIDRASVTGGVFVPTPTSTRLGNLQVVVSSSVAVVGGSSFTLGSTPRTAVVSGQTVTISPTAVIVGSETLTLPTRPPPTEVVVAGGDLVTAIGQSVVVIKSTTITYGLTGTSTTVIDDDTVTFGPGGVTVHGTTLGGTTAKAGATDFAVVGGATITKVGASVVVIAGHTYTVGPGTGSTTTVVGGETITVAPDGVTVSTLTLPWPFGPTTVITPGATPTEPSATAASATEDAAAGLRPDGSGFMAAACLAVGMMFLGV